MIEVWKNFRHIECNCYMSLSFLASCKCLVLFLFPQIFGPYDRFCPSCAVKTTFAWISERMYLTVELDDTCSVKLWLSLAACCRREHLIFLDVNVVAWFHYSSRRGVYCTLFHLLCKTCSGGRYLFNYVIWRSGMMFLVSY